MKAKILFLLATILVLASLPTQASTKFEGFCYDATDIDDMCHSVHVEFGLSNYNPTDLITISVYDSKSKLIQEFNKFNTDKDPLGKPHEGWLNFFKITKLNPGQEFTIICRINGETVGTRTEKMLGKPDTPPIIIPEKPVPPLPFNIYPNPSQGGFFIEIPFSDANINITDADGKLIYSMPLDSDRQRINDYLANGIYFITLIKGDKIVDIKKLFINR